MDDKLMSTAEVAEYLGVSISTIHQWRYHGTAPRAFRVGKHLRFRRADIDTWLEGQVSHRSAAV